MARAHEVKKAAKDYPQHGIKKGEPYWWWSFMQGGRGGPKHYSKTRPKPSQLTQSEFWSAVHVLQEDNTATPELADIESDADSVKEALQDILDETQDKLDNLPEGFQQGASGELLQGRIDALQEAMDSIDGIDASFDAPDKEEGETDEDHSERVEAAEEERADEAWSTVTEALDGISCE